MALSPERRNVLILACTQALFQTASVMVLTLSGLVGQELATNKALATLPIAMMVIGSAATMIPASLLMQRLGRRVGFLLGTAAGAMAGLTAAYAIWAQHFWLFAFANMLVGVYQGFAQYYRFAAADLASPAFRSRAISWVIAGGVVAAIAGPNLVRLTQHLGPVTFAPPYLIMVALAMVAAALLTRIALPPQATIADGDTARPLATILRQPVFLTALTGSAVGFGVMSLVMTATPLAMQHGGHSIDSATTVIQWHVLGMFAPSFITGSLIQRFGVLRIMATGIALLTTHVGIALSGDHYLHFLSGLTLLGIGWNFLFVGGTTLLTEAHTPAERAKTQAAHDFLMFAVVSVASFSAGGLLNVAGWHWVNLAALPALALALSAILALAWRRRQVEALAAD